MVLIGLICALLMSATAPAIASTDHAHETSATPASAGNPLSMFPPVTGGGMAASDVDIVADDEQESKDLANRMGYSWLYGGKEESDTRTLLPLFRWKGAIAQPVDSRLNGISLDNMMNTVSANVVMTGAFNTGNLAFSTAVNLTRFATTQDFVKVAGAEVDKAFALVGKALQASGIVGFLVVLALLIGMFQAARRSSQMGLNPFKAIIKPIILIIVFSFMVMGASNTSGNSPGAGSPWWLTQKVTSVVSALANAPVAALSDYSAKTTLDWDVDWDQDDPLSCKTMMVTMAKQYQDAAGDQATKINRSLPQTLSGMWESTGLAAWVQAQYGRNEFGMHVFCRSLDSKSNVPVDAQIVNSGDKIPPTHPTAAAWNASGGTSRTINAFHWAACRVEGDKLRLHGKFYAVEGVKKGKDDDICNDWYTKPASGGTSYSPVPFALSWNPGAKKAWNFGNRLKSFSNKIVSNIDGTWTPDSSPFNFTGDESETSKKLTEHGSKPEVMEFALTAQGHNAVDGQGISLVYSITSIILLIVFGVVAGAVLLAKIGIVVMMMGLLLALIMDILPTSQPSRLGGYFGKFVGFIFVSSAVSLIFAVLMMFTRILLTLGNGMTGNDLFFATLWQGIAPLLAVFALHQMFRKWFKTASPFTPSGALAWGKNLGGLGARMGTGAGMGALMGAGNAGLSKLGSRFGGGSQSSNTDDTHGARNSDLNGGVSDGVSKDGARSMRPDGRRGEGTSGVSSQDGTVQGSVAQGGADDETGGMEAQAASGDTGSATDSGTASGDADESERNTQPASSKQGKMAAVAGAVGKRFGSAVKNVREGVKRPSWHANVASRAGGALIGASLGSVLGPVGTAGGALVGGKLMKGTRGHALNAAIVGGLLGGPLGSLAGVGGVLAIKGGMVGRTKFNEWRANRSARKLDQGAVDQRENTLDSTTGSNSAPTSHGATPTTPDPASMDQTGAEGDSERTMSPVGGAEGDGLHAGATAAGSGQVGDEHGDKEMPPSDSAPRSEDSAPTPGDQQAGQAPTGQSQSGHQGQDGGQAPSQTQQSQAQQNQAQQASETPKVAVSSDPGTQPEPTPGSQSGVKSDAGAKPAPQSSDDETPRIAPPNV